MSSITGGHLLKPFRGISSCAEAVHGASYTVTAWHSLPDPLAGQLRCYGSAKISYVQNPGILTRKHSVALLTAYEGKTE